MTGRVLGALYAWQSAEHRYMRYTSVCVVQKNVYVSASTAPYSQPATVPYVLLGMHRSHWITAAEPARPMHAGSRPWRRFVGAATAQSLDQMQPIRGQGRVQQTIHRSSWMLEQTVAVVQCARAVAVAAIVHAR
jgi:hypothetical protein